MSDADRTDRTTIKADDQFEVAVDATCLDITSHEDGVRICIPLDPSERRALAAALSPDQDGVRIGGRLTATESQFKRERDAAVARAEAAEKRHTWPKTTPTGHTYIAPDTYSALCHQHGNAAQAAVESWDAGECPPEPTWEMVGIAHREVERLQRECAEMRPSYNESVSFAYWVAKRLGCHVDALDGLTLTEMAERVAAKPDPPVSRADIEKAIRSVVVNPIWETTTEMLIDLVWSLVSGHDPAVYVVRESDRDGVELHRDSNGWGADQVWYPPLARDEWEAELERCQRSLVRVLAIRHALSADAAVDPIESLADDFAQALASDENIGGAWSMDPAAWRDITLTLARRAHAALGQEAGQ